MIIDFGIARCFFGDKGSDTTILGTPGYAAPEQFGFSQSDARTDIYAVGVLLNVMLTGKLPNEQKVPGQIGKIINKCIEIKTAKLVIGIISIVLFAFVLFQSCAAGIGNALSDNGERSGTSGVFVAICMLIAGIVGIATRKGVAGGFVSGVFYAIGGLIGIVSYGSYSDLMIWSILCFIFAVVFVVGSIMTKGNHQKNSQVTNEQ